MLEVKVPVSIASDSLRLVTAADLPVEDTGRGDVGLDDSDEPDAETETVGRMLVNTLWDEDAAAEDRVTGADVGAGSDSDTGADADCDADTDAVPVGATLDGAAEVGSSVMGSELVRGRFTTGLLVRLAPSPDKVAGVDWDAGAVKEAEALLVPDAGTVAVGVELDTGAVEAGSSLELALALALALALEVGSSSDVRGRLITWLALVVGWALDCETEAEEAAAAVVEGSALVAGLEDADSVISGAADAVDEEASEVGRPTEISGAGELDVPPAVDCADSVVAGSDVDAGFSEVGAGVVSGASEVVAADGDGREVMVGSADDDEVEGVNSSTRQPRRPLHDEVAAGLVDVGVGVLSGSEEVGSSLVAAFVVVGSEDVAAFVVVGSASVVAGSELDSVVVSAVEEEAELVCASVTTSSVAVNVGTALEDDVDCPPRLSKGSSPSPPKIGRFSCRFRWVTPISNAGTRALCLWEECSRERRACEC